MVIYVFGRVCRRRCIRLLRIKAGDVDQKQTCLKNIFEQITQIEEKSPK